MPLRAVFFDLDGTLLDTSMDLGNALNRVRIDENLPPLADDVIRHQVSNGANALIKLGFGEDLDAEQHQRYRLRLLDHYLENIAHHTVIFPGIFELVDKLTAKGLRWGVVTNKPWAYTEPLMAHFEFASPPSVMICPDHVTASKPSPEPLRLACQKTGCDIGEVIYVGDHQRDIECGRAAGAVTIAVGYGYLADPGEYLQWNATHTVETAEQIWAVIEEYL